MTVLARHPLTVALATAIATVTEKLVGVGHAPSGADASVGYVILYPVEGGGYSGPAWRAPDADAEWVYQVTSVGKREDQVEQIADRARAAVLARDATGAFDTELAPAGMRVMDRRPGGGGGFDPESEVDVTVVSWPERFVFVVTPA